MILPQEQDFAMEVRPLVVSRELGGSPSSSDDEITLRRIFLTFWRRKWLIAATTALTVALGAYVVSLLTARYTADATIVLDFRERRIVDIDGVVSGLSATDAAIRSEVDVLRSRALAGRVVDSLDLINDPEFNPDLVEDKAFSVADWIGRQLETLGAWFAERISLPALIEGLPEPLQGLAAADATDPEPVPQTGSAATRTLVIERVRSRLNVFNDGRSYTILVSFTSTDPDKAATIANAYAESYLARQ